MNIAIIIDALLPVTLYGGTERVAYGLGKALADVGHTVTFLCRKGSQSPFARIVAYDPSRPVAVQLPSDIDIVHFNNTTDLRDLDKPYVVTLHGNGMQPGHIDRNSIFVSANHAARYGCDSYVHNGLDWDDYGRPDLTRRRDRMHFLGNAAWRVKNVKGAIAVARRAGIRLDVLGGNRLNLKMGLRFTPYPSIRFHGMVDNEAKRHYIERSRGLLFPVTWHEPFGLAVIESLYFGAPVFATPYGSLPELVTPADGTNVGYLSTSVDAMATDVSHGRTIPPRRCHEYAVEMFSSAVMARAYLAKYEQVLNGKPLISDVTPVTNPSPRHLPWK